MPPEGYEFQAGTEEQIEVFMDLQRMIVSLFNRWEGDTAIAVFSAALGSAVGMIETQYKEHLDECPTCRASIDEAVLASNETAKNNFDYYYNRVIKEHERTHDLAKDLVDAFFKGRH